MGQVFDLTEARGVPSGASRCCCASLRDRTRYAEPISVRAPAYWIVFGLLAFTLAAGVIVNGVESGPIFAGLRNYLRAIPWFFVPAVFAFSDKQVRTQLRVLLAICLLQVPVAIEQRIYTTGTYYGFEAVTGDWTIGTLLDSGILSIFLVAAACVVAGLTIRRS